MVSCVILGKSPTFSDHLPSCISTIFNCFVLPFLDKQLFFLNFGQAGSLLQHKGSFSVEYGLAAAAAAVLLSHNMWHLISWTRNQTCAPCSGSEES